MDPKESISILSKNVKQLREMLRNRENDYTILDKAQTLLDTMDDELRWLHDCIDSNDKESRPQDHIGSITEAIVDTVENSVNDRTRKDAPPQAIIRKEVNTAFKEVLTNMAKSLDEP